MERDPRVDPMPGDVLRFGRHKIDATVAQIDGEFINYHVSTRKGVLACRCPVRDWLDFMIGATVVKRGDE